MKRKSNKKLAWLIILILAGVAIWHKDAWLPSLLDQISASNLPSAIDPQPTSSTVTNTPNHEQLATVSTPQGAERLSPTTISSYRPSTQHFVYPSTPTTQPPLNLYEVCQQIHLIETQLALSEISASEKVSLQAERKKLIRQIEIDGHLVWYANNRVAEPCNK